MRRPALIALAVLTAAPASACRDFISSDDNNNTPLFEGSFGVQEMVPSGGGDDLIAQGWDVGITFARSLGVYLIVRMPPEQQFAEPQVSIGGFTQDDEERISYTDQENEPLEMGAYTVEGTQGNQTVLFDFEEGSLGFLQMLTAPMDLGDLSTAFGTYEATEFVLTDADGEGTDLLADPGTEIAIALEPQSNWPALGGYQMTLDAPAGVLADTAVSLAYPDQTATQQQELFVGVGQSIVFFGLLGCDAFAGGDVELSGAIAFRGYACDLAGESYMLRARFEGT